MLPVLEQNNYNMIIFRAVMGGFQGAMRAKGTGI